MDQGLKSYVTLITTMLQIQSCESLIFLSCFNIWHRILHLLSPEEKRQHFATPLLVSLQNDVQGATKKFPYWWCITSHIWVVLLIGWSKLSINPKHYPDLGGNTSSEWNFFDCSLEVILQRNPWLHCKMISAFSKVKKWESQNNLVRSQSKSKKVKKKVANSIPFVCDPYSLAITSNTVIKIKWKNTSMFYSLYKWTSCVNSVI